METTATRFYDVKGVDIENDLEDNLKIAIKQGYSCFAWHINSDEEHLFLCKNWEDAENKAIEMYKKSTGYDDLEKEFYHEKVNIREVNEFLKELNS